MSDADEGPGIVEEIDEEESEDDGDEAEILCCRREVGRAVLARFSENR